MDSQWVWHPHEKAQSLEHLIANNVGTVSGQMLCSNCKAYQYLQLDLEAAFHELRDRLVASRDMIRGPEFGLGAHVLGIQCAEFASTSCARLVCPNCGKKSMSPVMPKLEPLVTETKYLFHLREVEEMNILFLLLGKFLRFCNVDQLYAIWLHLGSPFPPNRIPPRSVLPHRMSPKQAYLIALSYRLAKILDPDNHSLDIGSWPFRSSYV